MKAHPFKIVKPLHQSLIVQFDIASKLYDKLHQHEEIQISYIKEGYGKLVIADSFHSFRKGAIFIIGSNNPHVFRTAESCKKVSMITLFFNKKSFENYGIKIPELELLNHFLKKTEGSLKVLSKKKSIAELMEQLDNSDKFLRFIIFLQLIQKISKAQVSTLSKFIYSKKITNREGKRMQLIFDYVMKNFQRTITLEEISALTYMTPNAFCRFFKQRTNKTFFQFLISVRIEHACQLLENEKELDMLTISLQSGFNSISNFNRQFKAIKNCAPSNYIPTEV